MSRIELLQNISSHSNESFQQLDQLSLNFMIQDFKPKFAAYLSCEEDMVTMKSNDRPTATDLESISRAYQIEVRINTQPKSHNTNIILPSPLIFHYRIGLNSSKVSIEYSQYYFNYVTEHNALFETLFKDLEDTLQDQIAAHYPFKGGYITSS